MLTPRTGTLCRSLKHQDGAMRGEQSKSVGTGLQRSREELTCTRSPTHKRVTEKKLGRVVNARLPGTQKSGYNPHRWVRCLTHAESYICRIGS